MKTIAILLIPTIALLFSSNAGTTNIAEYDCSASYAEKVFCETNNARKYNGLENLTYSKELIEVSKLKSDSMCKNKYFSHDYNGESWTKYINESGLHYVNAGENLAKGYNTPSEAVQALLNSPTHKDNIMGDYTHLGVYTSSCGGINYTTQTFATL